MDALSCLVYPLSVLGYTVATLRDPDAKWRGLLYLGFLWHFGCEAARVEEVDMTHVAECNEPFL